MLFLTVPGGTTSLQRGLFMGSPGMYIRGFVKGGGIRKGRGVFGSYVELMLSYQELSSACVFQYFYLLSLNLQSYEQRNESYRRVSSQRYCHKNELCVLCMTLDDEERSVATQNTFILHVVICV